MGVPEFVPNQPGVSPAIGGHMLYHKHIEITPEGVPIFVKAFDPNLLTMPEKGPGMQAELAHEARMYQYLHDQAFDRMPEDFSYADDTLRIRAYLPEDGWQWDVPSDLATASTYASEVLDTLDGLQSIPPLSTPHPSTTSLFVEKGWPLLRKPEHQALVTSKIDAFAPFLHTQSAEGAEALQRVLHTGVETLANLALTAAQQEHTQLGHFDARPSNIAWHPTEGVRIIDWSWASNTSPHSDSTMFLIDVHKADFETRNLPSFEIDFNRGHAALFIGYWLARCVMPAPDLTVRFHQFASAATAMTLLG